MDWLQLLVLAVIQGLTEFLPVSSSAHLILPAQLLGWEDQGLAFDVAVHIGTLLAVLWYYRSYVARMTVGALHGVQSRQMNVDLRLAVLLDYATLQAVYVGFLFKVIIKAHIRLQAEINVTYLLLGILVWIADRRVCNRVSLAAVG